MEERPLTHAMDMSCMTLALNSDEISCSCRTLEVSLRLLGHLNLFLPSVTKAVQCLHMATSFPHDQYGPYIFVSQSPTANSLLCFSTSCLVFPSLGIFFLGRGDCWAGVCYHRLPVLEAFSNSKALVCLNTLDRISPLRLAVHLDTEMWLPRR